MGRPNVTATPSMLIYPELLKNEEVYVHLATAARGPTCLTDPLAYMFAHLEVF